MKHTNRESGAILLAALSTVVVVAGLVATAHLLTVNNAKMTSRSRDMAALESTAEGILDYQYGIWKSAMASNAGPITSSQATALVAINLLPALPQGMEYVSVMLAPANEYGAPTSDATRINSQSENPKGWPAVTYNYLARVTLRQLSAGGNSEVTLQRNFRHDLIPPVGGIFYTEGDFELYKPAPMIIGGNVHTNQNGYVSTHYSDSNKLRFLSSSNISFVGSYAHVVPPFGNTWSNPGANDTQVPVYDRGYTSQVSQTDRLEGIGAGTTGEFDLSDANPNNDGNHELIEPPVSGFVDPPAIAASRIFNNAGLVVQITGPVDVSVKVTQTSSSVYTGDNIVITAKNGTNLNKARADAIVAAMGNSVTEVQQQYQYVYNSSKKKWEWQWVNVNVLVEKKVYDKREGKDVKVADINMGTLAATLDTVPGFNDILYVYNPTSTASDPRALRLTNAGILPTDGLTLATQDGIYVVGDFNTGATTNPNDVPSNNGGNPNNTDQNYKTGYTPKPAALVADAVMFLSNSWSDSNASKSLSNRSASHTTVNAAIIAGYVPSGWVNPSGSQYGYSGGANNFPRFLENWGSISMTFYGAMVQLYQSKNFAGRWDTGDIYGAPSRRWNFDTLLLERVIPGIPPASSFGRGRTRRI